MNTDQVVAELIAISKAMETLELDLAERERPYQEEMAAVVEAMNAELQGLRDQHQALDKDLKDRKQKLIDAWPVDSGRIERFGWTIDRKERKSVVIKSEELLAVKLLARVAWDKQPFTIKFNNTKLAKLVENGVIPEDIAEPTVTVSIAITPPKALLDEEQAAMEKHDRIEDARKEAEKEE